MFKFNQRDLLRCTTTGFTGVVTCRSEWTNGCIRYQLQAKELKDGKPLDVVSFDEQDLELVEAQTVTESAAADRKGGPRAETMRRADPGC